MSSPSPRHISRPQSTLSASKLSPHTSPGLSPLAALTDPLLRAPTNLPTSRPLTPLAPATLGLSGTAGPVTSSTVESSSKKRKIMDNSPNLVGPDTEMKEASNIHQPLMAGSASGGNAADSLGAQDRPAKKHRTNTPWTPAEEKRLKAMRDENKTWSEIAKTFPNRTEGSVKKHWYKDMHYADFAEDESEALLQAIKEYDANKWKVIGQKVGKPAKACEQYAKEHFAGQL